MVGRPIPSQSSANWVIMPLRPSSRRRDDRNHRESEDQIAKPHPHPGHRIGGRQRQQGSPQVIRLTVMMKSHIQREPLGRTDRVARTFGLKNRSSGTIGDGFAWV
jgi:hypothetical protein